MALALPGSLAALALLALSPVQPVFTPPLDPHVFQPNAQPFGASYSEWTARWWQWFLAQPVVGHPGLDDGLFDVAAGQSGPVWFLASLLDPTPTAHVRNITVPKNTALCIALLNFEASSLEDPFPTTDVEQRAIANFIADQFQDLTLSVDCADIDVDAFRFASPQFSFTAPSPWIFGPVGGTGTAVSDGYFVMLKHLKRGHHTVHMTGNVPAFGLSMDMTYNITVV